jgi:ribosome-associated heat shock protein Hsp15
MSAVGVRLDRWLWAARFFRTRAKAKAAIEGGKVMFHEQRRADAGTLRPKVSKEVTVGDYLSIRRGWTSETVRVDAVSEQRGSAESARALYTETPQSIEKRELEVARRRMERAGLKVPARRPGKRDRREIRRLKEEQ